MLTYLLEKFDKIKKRRNLYCAQFDSKKDGKSEISNRNNDLLIYEFICKNLRTKWCTFFCCQKSVLKNV